MKIGVFLPNWIGDAVMATPALRAIRSRFADAEIVAILRPYVADVLAGTNLVDKLLPHDPKSKSNANRGWQFVSSLRRERLDVAVLFPNSFHSAMLARLAGAKRRVGMNRDGRGWLLTDKVTPKSKKQPNPVIDEYLRLAEHLGCTNLSRDMALATLPEDERRLDEFWNRHDPRLRKAGVVCLNPGGAFGAAKHWPTESFAALAHRIAAGLGRTVLVLCGPAEKQIASEIVCRANHPHVFSLADVPLSIGLTKAAVRSAELLVTTDSGPRHFAAPFDVPVITLFGPTHIAWSETFYRRAIHLQHKVPCGPCQQRTCPLEHHACMRDLTVDRVFAAVLSSIGTNAARIAKAS